MTRKIMAETAELINRLYDDNVPLPEIARKAGVSYTTVYGRTKLRQKMNPETGERFRSYSEYEDYLAGQRVNPETGERFGSDSEYRDYQVRQRQTKPENKQLGSMIKRRLKELQKKQSWLAGEIGVTQPTVSLYAQGKLIPNNGTQEKLYRALGVQQSKDTLRFSTIALQN